MKKNASIISLVIILFSFVSLGVYTYLKHPEKTGCLNDQMISFLQEYIRIDTTHPHPHYDEARAFLKKHAARDNFSYKEIPLPSGNTVLVITYQGTDPRLPALVLNHHMDVVPALNTHEWIKPPFEGAIYNGDIIGRGTQDMKGVAAIHYFALKQIKELNAHHARTIHIFAVPDEEIGGFKGTKEFVESPEFKKLNVGFVLDEGHSSGSDYLLDVKVAERKPIQIEVTCYGSLSHGSRLLCHNSIHELISFLNHIVTLHTEQQHCACSHQPGELTSYNITSLTAGVRRENNHLVLNMVPDTAQATIDIRVPPSRKKQQVITEFEDILHKFPHLQYKILVQAMEEPEISDYNTPLYKTLKKTARQFNLDVAPHFFEASSDLRFYQAQGITGAGFTPFTVQDNIHGTNESVPVEQLIRGKDIMVEFLKEFCR